MIYMAKRKNQFTGIHISLMLVGAVFIGVVSFTLGTQKGEDVYAGVHLPELCRNIRQQQKDCHSACSRQQKQANETGQQFAQRRMICFMQCQVSAWNAIIQCLQQNSPGSFPTTAPTGLPRPTGAEMPTGWRRPTLVRPTDWIYPTTGQRTTPIVFPTFSPN